MPGLSSTSPDTTQLSRDPLAEAGNRVLVSVVIPTRDRPHALRRCLEALSTQSGRFSKEIIVVDDGSILAKDVEDAVSEAGAALIRQSPRGPAAARNAGARAAKGSFVCFVDDDCVPLAGWVQQLVTKLRRDADAVGGKTVPATETALALASELIAQAPRSPNLDEELAFAPSNNLACSRETALAFPFDESYPSAAGEDREWCARLLRSGRLIEYESSAVVVHHQDLDFRAFLRQQLRYGRGAFRFRRLGAERRSLEHPFFYVRLLRVGFAHGLLAGSCVVVAQVVTGLGFAAEWLATRRQSNRLGVIP